MANIEFEHSFKVKDLKPFIDFCENNGYRKTMETNQNRIVYENGYNNKVIARLTTDTIDGTTKTVLDFKNVNSKHGDLNISSESIPMVVNQDNKDCILSMLDTLNFVIAANNYRTRFVYEKDNVKFEMDDYINLKTKVVAIEGEKCDVEKVYNCIKDLIELYKE